MPSSREREHAASRRRRGRRGRTQQPIEPGSAPAFASSRRHEPSRKDSRIAAGGVVAQCLLTPRPGHPASTERCRSRGQGDGTPVRSRRCSDGRNPLLRKADASTFRFATERQSDSSRVLAEGSPGCKHERCRSGGNAVVVIPASGSDDSRKRSIVIRDTTRLPDPRKATMLRLGSNRGAEHRLGVPPVTIQHVR